MAMARTSDAIPQILKRIRSNALKPQANWEDEIDYVQVNAFTDRAFAGNPAAVCYLPPGNAKDDRWLQSIAREFNLSETAFITKRQDEAGRGEGEGNEFDLRWFTPATEVDLCGHATLASAHLLFAAGIVEADVIRFHTRVGVLQARKVRGYDVEAEGGATRATGKGVVELDFPIATAEECSSEQVQELKRGLRVEEVVWAGFTSLDDFLVELPSSEHVVAVRPLMEVLASLPGRGVIVTARAGSGTIGQHQDVDFLSRFFAPRTGLDEDPVTGSAHCALGWYWKSKLGKARLEAYQASERGGRISVRVEESGRVYLEGGVVLVMAGVIFNTQKL